MKCDKDFLEAYNSLFKYLRRHSCEEVITFWEKFSDVIKVHLTDLIRRKGLFGCLEYWAETLSAEEADCKITYDTQGSFEIEMRKCPSLRKLSDADPHYCMHCDILYRRILEPLGYKYEIRYDGKGKCKIKVSK